MTTVKYVEKTKLGRILGDLVTEGRITTDEGAYIFSAVMWFPDTLEGKALPQYCEPAKTLTKTDDEIAEGLLRE
jgi:hypothetical protein